MTKFKSLKKLAALSAIAAMCGFAKGENTTNMGEIEDVTSLPTGEMIVKKSGAKIGIDTPWMFVRPDAESGFANDFTTNATEVVSDGTNVYANVNGKITQFTLDENGFPSKKGQEFGLMNADGTTTNTTAKLVAAKDGKLVAIDTNNVSYAQYLQNGSNYVPKSTKNYQGEYIDSKLSGDVLYILRSTGTTKFTLSKDQGKSTGFENPKNPTCIEVMNGKIYVGDKEGNVNDISTGLNGSISGLTTNGSDMFATSESTNAYAKVGSGLIQTTAKEGLKKVIDNRAKNGKMVYVTRSGFGMAD